MSSKRRDDNMKVKLKRLFLRRIFKKVFFLNKCDNIKIENEGERRTKTNTNNDRNNRQLTEIEWR